VNPLAQLILCVPHDLPDLDRSVLSLNARAFVLKPVEEGTFRTLIEQTLAQIHLRRERLEHSRATRRSAKIDEIVGKSEPIRHVLELIDRVAEGPTTSVLLLGESGVGKSLFAHTIHERSRASTGPFIEINCAAIPMNLLESELFGYEPGAFTDARGQKIGLIELADTGTLFLDEITEIPAHPGEASSSRFERLCRTAATRRSRWRRVSAASTATSRREWGVPRGSLLPVNVVRSAPRCASAEDIGAARTTPESQEQVRQAGLEFPDAAAMFASIVQATSASW
jgi:hypothetical protein